jgi:hypothetical protein
MQLPVAARHLEMKGGGVGLDVPMTGMTVMTNGIKVSWN